jgi:hypothetical protein
MSRPTIAFDPGATTGFAALDATGQVLMTRALTFSELEPFLQFCTWMDIGAGESGTLIDVVVEEGPKAQHYSPITKKAEAKILAVFPFANLVPPSRWKNHPASRSCKGVYRYATLHEKDAARLAHWFQVTGESNAEDQRADDSARTNAKRS